MIAPSTSTATIPRPVRRPVALGDSTAVGLGDPLPDGSRRGFPVLLRDALGGPDRIELTVLARTGARMAHAREVQVPAAAWLLGKGVPWLLRGARDLGPAVARALLRAPAAAPPVDQDGRAVGRVDQGRRAAGS